MSKDAYEITVVAPCRLQMSNQMIDFYKTWYARYGTGGYVTSYKYNVSVNNTTLYFICNKNSILSGRHVSTFIRSSSGSLGKQIQELSIFVVFICYILEHIGMKNIKFIADLARSSTCIRTQDPSF